MKIYILKLWLCFFSMGLILSCEKGLETYNEKPTVYFNESGRLPIYTGEVIKDSTLLSFSLAKSKDSIVNMVISTIGNTTTQDRPYKLVINPASTAIAGTHYQILNQDFSIKKNKLKDTIKIKVFRTLDMQSNTFLLSFDLQENENFSTLMKNKTINSAGKKHSFINYRWFLNDIIKKPSRWLDTYFGTFTRKKLFLLVSVLNVDPAYMDTSMSIAEGIAYSKYLQRYLNEEKADGKTIYEDDGSEMIMGPSVQ